MIHIVIPTYLSDPLHIEFTQKTLDSIKTSHPYHIFIIDNFHLPNFQPKLRAWHRRPHITVLKNPKGNFLSAAWNIGIKTGLSTDNPPTHSKSDYILIANNDIIFHPQCIDNLIEFAITSNYLLWSASEWSNFRTLQSATLTNSHSPHPHFSCFMLNQQTIDTVGLFDENLGVYFEDNDYHTRILLTKNAAGSTDSAKFYHFGSRTTAVDDHLAAVTKRNYQKNRQYLKKKWGLDFHAKGFSPPESILTEIYPHPFNNPQYSPKDW